MNRVQLKLPPGAREHNFLFRTTNPNYLTQDILTVELSNGYCITVGWFPEHDPNGEYQINVFWQSWDRQKLPPISAATVDDVVEIVQQLAVEFSQESITASPARTDKNSFNVRLANA